MKVLCLASALVFTATLSGCGVMGQYQRYSRPQLFYPTTAILKQRLDAGSPPAAAAPSAQPAATTPPAVESPQLLVVGEVATNDDTVQDLRVSDQCGQGQVPQLHAEPSAMIVSQFVAEPGTSRWFKATFDASKVEDYIGDLDITVIGCGAANMSAALAQESGLIVKTRVRIGYRRLVTNYNLWAQGDVENEFGAQFASTFTVADVVFENPNDRPILIYGSSLRAQVRFLASVADVREVLGDQAIENPELLNQHMWGDRPASEALDFTDYIRPMAYSDILAIFGYQQEADPRARTISTLKSIGELAAGAAVFVTAPDYGSGVALFTGIIIPELEKQLLWDVLKHLKNLESRSLKEVEELPERGELRRVVFFPKRAIPNFLPPFPMYIAEITAEHVPVKAVLLEKKATITNGSED
jgi:hypothetical protein